MGPFGTPDRVDSPLLGAVIEPWRPKGPRRAAGTYGEEFSHFTVKAHVSDADEMPVRERGHSGFDLTLGGNMERTISREIERAGLRIAVESRDEFHWDQAGFSPAEDSLTRSNVDIRVHVSCGEISLPSWDPITYAFEGGHFDVDLVDGQWWVAVHAQGRRFERVACFNRALTEGQVVIAPGLRFGLAHPLDGPLLDWLVTHAIMQRGGLVLQGSAILESGTALAVLDPEPGLVGAGLEGTNWDGSAPVVTPGSRFAVMPADNGFRVFALDSTASQEAASCQGELKAIHVVDKAAPSGMSLLEIETAMDAVLTQVCAPIHAPELADRILTAVARLVAQVPVACDGRDQSPRTASFEWGSPETQMGFAMPNGWSSDSTQSYLI